MFNKGSEQIPDMSKSTKLQNKKCFLIKGLYLATLAEKIKRIYPKMPEDTAKQYLKQIYQNDSKMSVEY